jgi:hypothetical protein
MDSPESKRVPRVTGTQLAITGLLLRFSEREESDPENCSQEVISKLSNRPAGAWEILDVVNSLIRYFQKTSCVTRAGVVSAKVSNHRLLFLIRLT